MVAVLAVLLVIAALLWILSLFLDPLTRWSQFFLIAWVVLATVMLAGVEIDVGGDA